MGGGNFLPESGKAVSRVDRCKEKRAKSLFFFFYAKPVFYRHAQIAIPNKGLLGNYFWNIFCFILSIHLFIYKSPKAPKNTQLSSEEAFLSGCIYPLIKKGLVLLLGAWGAARKNTGRNKQFWTPPSPERFASCGTTYIKPILCHIHGVHIPALWREG